MKRFEKILQDGLYRSRQGIILGVCRGIADYFDFSVFWIRIVALILLLITGFWPITGIYFIAALLMKPEPVIPIHTAEEQEFYDSYTSSKPRATQRIQRRFKNLNRRLQRMEDIVTSAEYDWDRRFNNSN